MADQTDTPPATDPNRFVTATLEHPVIRGETKIETLTVRKPKGGELRGTSLQDLLTTDVTALLKVIPRVTNPPLTQHEADNLEAEDLAEIGGIIRGFFTTKAERAAIEALIAEHTPKT